MKFCPVCKRNWDDEFQICPIDGLRLQPAAPQSDPYVGQVAGTARVVEKIDDGDIGPIYRADDPGRGVLAVQFINPDRLSVTVIADAFEDAVNLAAKINHPNVMGVYSLEHTANGQSAVLMEYVRGSSLENYRKSHPEIDVEQACRIVKDAGEGIAAAHRISMMHGSLQPSRILIAADGRVKVGGFHRSGLREEGATPSPASAGIGYMAPERIGITQDLIISGPDYRVDVYSLGVVLYELLAGRLPYEAKNAQELGAAMEAGPPNPPGYYNPQVSHTLSRVVLKAISRHPADRQKSMDDFVRDVEAARQPIRQPENSRENGRQAPRWYASAEDIGVSGQPSDPWQQTPEGKQGGEGSFFSWFKTPGGGKPKGREPEFRRSADDDPSYHRKSASPVEEDSEERTVIAGGKRKRSWSDTMTDVFARSRYGRDPDLSQTDVLPRRRFFGKNYIWMIAAAAVLALCIILGSVWYFGKHAAGKLTVNSDPRGANVYLDDRLIGTTPMPAIEVKNGTYALRVELNDYETARETLEVNSNSDIQRYFQLKRENLLTAGTVIQENEPVQPPAQISPPPAFTRADELPQADSAKYQARVRKSIQSRYFFPPEPQNAWALMQTWRGGENRSPTAEWKQELQSFCNELTKLGQEKLNMRDFMYVKSLLEQAEANMADLNCTAGLQSEYRSKLGDAVSAYRGKVESAIANKNYVTPDSDSALIYVRRILQIDPQNQEAKDLEGEMYIRAFEQAREKSKSRRHQDALAIFRQIQKYYFEQKSASYNPPLQGRDDISKGINRENHLLDLYSRLNVPDIKIQVKHGQRRWVVLKGASKGDLRVNGFRIQYQSDKEDSFTLKYEDLKSVSRGKNNIAIEGNAKDFEKIELEQELKNPSPSLEEVYKKIEEFRTLNYEYRTLLASPQ